MISVTFCHSNTLRGGNTVVKVAVDHLHFDEPCRFWLSPLCARLRWPSRTAAMRSRGSFSKRAAALPLVPNGCISQVSGAAPSRIRRSNVTWRSRRRRRRWPSGSMTACARRRNAGSESARLGRVSRGRRRACWKRGRGSARWQRRGWDVNV